MTNKRTTKRALLFSVLSMLLCVSMLMGTTFAWFTDSVSSMNNIIKSGNLDLEVEYTLDGENWNNLTTASDLFQKSLWEPGHTEVVALKVMNKGSLALKYVANMNIVNEVIGKNKDGGDIVLSDILTVSTLKQQTGAIGDIAVALAFSGENKVGYETTNSFKAANVLSGEVELHPGDAHYLIIKVDMAETVGNEANHDGKNVPSIEFGINFFATQYTAESDSFGSDYDKDAAYGTVIELNAGDDLLAAMASAKAGEPLTIVLNGDVEWPTDGHHGENDITSAYSIVIEGNGHTITATGSGVTPLGDDKAPMTLKNVKIVDDSKSYDESAWELSYLEMGGRVLNCVDVDFVDPITVDSDKATFTGCTFVGHYDKNSTSTTQYGVWVSNGDATFTGCTFTGTRGLKICDLYAPEVGTVVVDGCTFNGISEKPGVVIDNRGEGDVSSTEGMTVIIKNSTFINCKAGDQGLYIYETDNTVPTLDNNKVYNNATFIGTASEFLALGGKSLTGTYVLTADIDLGGAVVPTIGAAYGKELKIEGNGYTISNGTTAHTSHNGMKHHGLFYAYTNSILTISDLVIDNVDIDATADTERNYGAAVVVAFADGGSNVTLKNVDVKNCDVKNNTPDIGDEAAVYVGYQTGTLTMIDCDSTGCSVAGETAQKTGAFIGMVNGTATLTNCTTDLTIGTCNRVSGTLTEN